MKKQLEILIDLGACRSAIDWLETQPDFATAWAKCERSDWMLWLLERVKGVDQKQAALIACVVAKTALKYVPAEELRPAKAIETVERFFRGEAGLDELHEAGIDANTAADCAADYAAKQAAKAVAYAAYAAYCVTNAAFAIDYVINAVADAANGSYAAANAAAHAARDAARVENADIVRTLFPQPPI